MASPQGYAERVNGSRKALDIVPNGIVIDSDGLSGRAYRLPAAIEDEAQAEQPDSKWSDGSGLGRGDRIHLGDGHLAISRLIGHSGQRVEKAGIEKRSATAAGREPATAARIPAAATTAETAAAAAAAEAAGTRT
jgi:hypothetical protein